MKNVIPDSIPAPVLASAAAAGCAGLGFLAGVYYSRRVYRVRLETEIDAVKSHYQQRLEREAHRDVLYTGPAPVDDSDRNAGTDEADGADESSGGSLEAIEVGRAFAEDYLASGDDGADVRSVNLFDEANHDDTKPYLITLAEWSEDFNHFEKLTITYYAGDNVLVDDKESPIPNQDLTVGENIKEKFGIGSDDPNIAYIRNKKLEVDFEVILNEGKFTEIVLGYGNADTEYKRVPRRNE